MNDYDNVSNEKFIMDILTKISDNTKLTKLEDLANVELLRELIIEIEPKIEETANLGKITLTIDDTPSGNYLNMSTIIKHLQKYISYSIVHDSKKTYFPETTNIEKQIKINDLIKRNPEQLETIGEFLLFLIAMSSKINTWIDKIDEMDSETVTKYELFLEKFFYLSEASETPHPRETRYTLNFRKSIQNYAMEDYNSELFSKRSSNAIGVQSDFALEREKFQRLIHEAEKEKNVYMEKLNDALREIEILKDSNKQNLNKIEDLMSEIIKASEHKRLFELKEQEFVETKKTKDSQIKSIKNDKEKLLESLENMKDKLMQLSLVQSENEKLKIKLKEFSLFKDKNTENTTLLNTIESKDRIIDALSKENSGLLSKLEKCEEDFSNEKKKSSALSKDYENLALNFNALNEDFIRIKKFLDRKSIKIEDEQGIVLDELYSNEAYNNNNNNGENNKSSRNSEATGARRSQFRKKPIGKQDLNSLITEMQSEGESEEDNNGKIKDVNNTNANNKQNKEKVDRENANKQRFSFEDSDDESKNQGIALNSVIGDRVSVLKDNYLRFKKDENYSNNFMSMASFSMLNKKTNWETNELSIKSTTFDLISNKKPNQANFNNYYIRRRITNANQFDIDNEKKYLDAKIDAEERLKLSLMEIERVKSEFEDYKAKSKIEFELISSSLFEMAHQFIDMKTKNEISNDKSKTKNWLQSERNKIFPLDK